METTPDAASSIASRLGETDDLPCAKIRAIVAKHGEEFALSALRQIEEAVSAFDAGQPVLAGLPSKAVLFRADGLARRTLGGSYFALVKALRPAPPAPVVATPPTPIAARREPAPRPTAKTRAPLPSQPKKPTRRRFDEMRMPEVIYKRRREA